MAAMQNMTSFPHKFYIFKLIDAFGIYYPQAVICCLTLAIWAYFHSTFIGLQERPKETWYISDSVFLSSNDSKKEKKA